MKEKRNYYFLENAMTKNLNGYFLLILSLCVLTGCARTKPKINDPEIRAYWGDKTQIATFLDSPSAKSERWLIEALGE